MKKMDFVATLKTFQFSDLNGLTQTRPRWDLLSTQMGSGQVSALYTHLQLRDLLIIHDLESLGASTHYHLPENTTLFVLLRPKTLSTRWCGIDVSNDTFVVNICGQEYLAVTPNGYDAIEILVSNTTIIEMNLLPDWLMPGSRISARWVIPLPTPDGWKFRQWLFNLFASTNKLLPLTADSLACTLFREELLERLSNAVDQGLAMHGYSTRVRLSRRYRLIRRAVEVIEEHLSETIGTLDLANALDVSPRVLQYAFKDVVGNSPYEYVLKRRLQAVRQELCRSSRHGKTVSQVALDYGFKELGQFSRRYAKLFGELPSATLQKASNSRNKTVHAIQRPIQVHHISIM